MSSKNKTMKNITTNWLYGFIIVLIMSLSSCGTYGPALTNTVQHLESPEYRDQNASANYISAQIGLGNRFEYRDNNAYAKLNFHRANTYEYGSLTYGAFGYLGSYGVGDSLDVPALTGRKPYSGLGLVFGGNFHVPFEKVDFEVIKFTARLYNELGEYPKFKRELVSENREGHYEDLYVRHNSIVDMAFGMGVKIKHANQRATRISTGIVTHIFSKSCSDNGNCYNEWTGLAGINLQVGHSVTEQFSLNLTIASGFSSSGVFPDTSYPIATLGMSYRFGKR